MERTISIYLCTQKDPLILPGETKYVAENLCIYAAKHCGISPASRHLFALWCPAKQVWLSPCKITDTNTNKELILHFLLRFKPPSIERMKEQTDPQTFNYYFHQMRSEFLQGKIKQLQNHVEESLGLAATDIIRETIELQIKPDNMKYTYTNFLPRELCKWPIVFFKDRLQKAIMKGWANSRQNLDYVKEQYMKQLTNLVTDYHCEQFQAQVDENGKVWQVTLQVDPYNEKQPGLQMQVKGSKGVWTQICSIENLCYISMRSDGTVEISRRNGIPQYLRFSNMDQSHSFVSLLDGYYRLMEKWTFNICKDLVTPSLLNLRILKCHGPIRRGFSYQKLKEKCKNEAGSYILRESASSYDEYRLDVCDSANNVKTYCIQQAENGDYCIEDYDEIFSSIPKLLDNFTKRKNGLRLKKCIPPSEYEKTHLLLCRPNNRDTQTLKTRGECSCSAQCIPYDAIVFNQQLLNEFLGDLTLVKQAQLRRGGDNLKQIAVKQLKQEVFQSYMQEFLSQCDKVLFWQCDAIISTIGVVLSPLSFIMEYLPLGRLDIYLQEHRQALQQVDLVEASNYIARALWYLDEQQCCHGKIRCHNVLVSSHSDSSFRVKLADPGVIAYSENDIHWIPPECYNDYSLAAKSSAADVWAFGTTLWELFSFGEIPYKEKKYCELKECYIQGHHPLSPPGCHIDIGKLMSECWSLDPDSRKRPQAIMRDVNQILYEVYNSRRTHSYATIYPQENSPVGPLSPPPCPPRSETTSMNHRNNFIKNALKFVSSPGFNYDHLSNSSMSSDQSRTTIMSDATEASSVPVASLIKLDESEFRDANTPILENSQSHWMIDPTKLVLAERLGQGFYGEVYKATLTHVPGCSETVAVKRIRKSALSEESFQGLLSEFGIMKTLQHENIVEIKAFAEEPEIMLVMEFIKLGSLLAYLTMHKERIRCPQLLKFGADIANGMKYLEQKHVVHRDLAVRNILVASEDCVKISDFGLARFTENDYYKMKTERNLPIRWYAPESIIQMKFSHKSDVWSFGVTLWEMFSYGENPVIPGISDPKLAEALQKGIRLACPEYCPPEVYGLMKDCWELDSHKRPSFSIIREQIVDLTKRSWT